MRTSSLPYPVGRVCRVCKAGSRCGGRWWYWRSRGCYLVKGSSLRRVKATRSSSKECQVQTPQGTAHRRHVQITRCRQSGEGERPPGGRVRTPSGASHPRSASWWGLQNSDERTRARLSQPAAAAAAVVRHTGLPNRRSFRSLVARCKYAFRHRQPLTAAPSAHFLSCAG